MTAKFDALVKRLRFKIENSQTPVPGFIIGLSGTDSIVALMALNAASTSYYLDTGRRIPIIGLHYISGKRRKPGMFEAVAMPWLRAAMPDVSLLSVEPLGGNQDQQRWADLHLRALNRLDTRLHADNLNEQNSLIKPWEAIVPREPGQNFWVVGTINATEQALGKYSMLSTAVSIQPIRSLWKSDIMAICAASRVPQQVIDAARIPDCLCGRDELAAENIELLDQIIRNDFDPSAHSPVLLKRLIDYVRETKREQDWHNRVPYIV